MGVLERKEREKEFRRQQILTAGETMFVKHGLQNTTMEQIANLCEISRGTLYLYFESKEALFHTILLKGLSIMYDMMKNEVDKYENVLDKLRGVGTAYLEFYKKYKNYFKLVNHFEDHSNYKPCDGSDSAIQLIAKTEEIWKLITEVIEEGVAQNYFKKDTHPFETAILLWSSSNGIIQLMDHINISHNGKMPHNLSDKQKLAAIGFTKIDFEQLLQKMWSMLLNSIRN